MRFGSDHRGGSLERVIHSEGVNFHGGSLLSGGGGIDRIGDTSVLGNIISDDFFLWRDTKNSGDFHGEEDWPDEGHSPRGHNDDSDEVCAEKSATAAVEASKVFSVKARGSLESLDVEEPRRHSAPYAGGSVDREGLQRIVDLEFEKQHCGGDVDKRANGTDDDGGIRVHECTRGGDSDQPGENSVETGEKIEDPVPELEDNQGDDTAGGGGEGSGHCAALGNLEATFGEREG